MKNLLLTNDTQLRQLVGDVKLHDRLYNRLLHFDINADGSPTPEGLVRIGWVVRLIKDYGFDSRQIEVEVPAGRVGRAADWRGNDTVFADIVAYRDIACTEPFIVIETKAPDEKGGILQAESYARNLGAEYHVVHDGKNPPQYYRTSRFAQKSERIGGIPHWIGTKPVISEIPKTVTLPSFRDENEMREVVHQCHELILEKQGHDPAKAFDELTKLLFLKLYDEREVPSVYKFMVVADETPEAVATKLREVFKKAIRTSRYKDVFSTKFNAKSDILLELDDFTIFQIVQLLQGYSLVNTTENLQGADIKGTVFEQMVGNTFRGELAQFFTPRELVQFIVEMIPPGREDTVFDPSCGSGGFLIMAINSIKERIRTELPNLDETEVLSEVRYYAGTKLFGADINDRMARVAKMNMIMHGDGHAGIFNQNGLETSLKEGKVDIIYSNPPFAGREKDPTVLNRFVLGKTSSGKPRSVSKEVLFIEMIIRLLRPGGRAGLVLPSGVFNNPSMTFLRDYIRAHCKIVALIGLPHLAFQVSGANNEGHILIIEKVEQVPQDYDVFIDWASDVGINAVGQKTNQNDLHEIVKRFRNPPQANLFRYSELQERIDPWYYHPNYKKLIQRLEKTGYPWLPIGRVFDLSRNLFKPRDYEDDALLKYIEKGDVDVELGRITGYTPHTPKSIPNRATFVLQENDILFPNAYDSIRGVTIVPAEYAGYIATNRFFVLQHNPTEMLLEFVRYFLVRPEILALIKRECSGEINPGINWNMFSKIRLPIPPIDEQRRILNELGSINARRNQLLRELAELDHSVNAEFDKALPKSIDNYEDVKIRRAEYIGLIRFDD